MRKASLYLIVFLFIRSNIFSQPVLFYPIADNTIYAENAALSNGAGPLFFVGKTGAVANTTSRRALLKFDLSQIPSGSAIISTTLSINCTMVPNGAVDNKIDLYRCLANWGEGSAYGTGQGALAATGDATWTCSFSSGGDVCDTAWAMAGGDFAATASSSILVTSTGNYIFNSSIEMTEDVRRWVDSPATNVGWLLKGNESVQKTARAFTSKEGDATATVLSIVYTPPVSCTGVNKWTGAVSNQWEVAGNWSCGKVPDANTDVAISSGNAVISSNAACRSIVVKTGAACTVSSGFSLAVAN
jgi:hypothetical protein